MTKREQLQAEIIEKQKEIDKAKDVVIEHYRNCMRKLTLYSPETIGYQEGVIKNIASELSALTTDLEKEGEDDETEQYEKCDVEGCDNVVTNGGVSWNKTGYWSTCSDHFSSSLRGDVQPSMKLSAIEREKSRDSKTGYLPSVKQVPNNRH